MIRSLLLAVVLIAGFVPVASAGTWGTGSFENDDAADFIVTVTEEAGTEALRAALRQATSEGLLEVSDGANAIVAAEIVAAALGKATPEASANADVMAWVANGQATIDPGLALAAVQALNKVLGDDSEMRYLWAETEQYESWRAGVMALRARLATP